MSDNQMVRREDNENIFPMPNEQSCGGGAMVEATISRQVAEVQASMIIAKRFPRDEASCFKRVMKACQRLSLAEQAMFSYPRGETTVTGPTIRLAEELARDWQNVDFGLKELEQRNGESTIEAYAHDLETNTRQTKVFQVRHERVTRAGRYPLTDPRDIYELVANQGARRLRGCILGIIPGDVVDKAIEQCEKTLAGGGGESLEERIKKALAAFASLGIDQARIEAKLGHVVGTTSEHELISLRKMFGAIKDNFASADDLFPAAKPKDANGTTAAAPADANPIAAAVKAKRGPKPKAEPAVAAPAAPVTMENAAAAAPAVPVDTSAPPATPEVSSPVETAPAVATEDPAATNPPTADEVWAKIQTWSAAHNGAWPDACTIRNITNKSVLKTLDSKTLWTVMSKIDEQE